MSRSRACAISTSVVSRSVGRTCFGGDRPLTCPAISCFAFWPIGCRPIGWVTLMPKVSGCSMQLALLKTPANARSRFKRQTTDVRPGTMLAREWNGRMQRVAVLADGFAWNGKTVSGACRKSPTPLLAPVGTDPSSLACVTSHLKTPKIDE